MRILLSQACHPPSEQHYFLCLFENCSGRWTEQIRPIYRTMSYAFFLSGNHITCCTAVLWTASSYQFGFRHCILNQNVTLMLQILFIRKTSQGTSSDLSDTFGHDIFEETKSFGFSILVLPWFKFISQLVCTFNLFSDPQEIVFSFPQGSFPDPLPFIMYISFNVLPLVTNYCRIEINLRYV